MLINLWPGIISCSGYSFALTFTCTGLIGINNDWSTLLMLWAFSFGLNLNILLNGYNLRLQEEINERKN